MFYLAHLSDIHLTPLPKPSIKELCNKRVTGYLNWQKNRSTNLSSSALNAITLDIKKRKPNHIVITGDIVNLALPAEFSNAQIWLKKQAEIADLSVTLGNHDAYLIGSSKKAIKHFKPWIKGNESEINAAKQTFPYLHIRGDVAIIGVSSAIATPIFCAAGYFGAKQSRDLAKILNYSKEQNLFRIILIHHPPVKKATNFIKCLFGINNFYQAINKEGAELILHGHTHLPTISYHNDIPIIGVSAAGQSFGNRYPAAGYNWLAIEKQQQKWLCNLKRYQIINSSNEIALVEERQLY